MRRADRHTHLSILTAPTGGEIISDFRKSTMLFIIFYMIFMISFALFGFLSYGTMDIQYLVPTFFIFILLYGLFILPKIHYVAELLLEKKVTAIHPTVLVVTQFIFNISIVTALIIPMFLWAKTSELKKQTKI